MSRRDTNRACQNALMSLKRDFGMGGYLDMVWSMRNYDQDQRNEQRATVRQVVRWIERNV